MEMTGIVFQSQSHTNNYDKDVNEPILKFWSVD